MMKETSDRNKFLESVVLSVIAMGVYNCVAQFVLNPYLNRTLGDEAFGDVLTLLSILSVVAMSIGVGVNYSRLANKPRFETVNGDYNRFLCLGAVVVVAVSVSSLCFFDNVSIYSFVLFPVLGVVFMLRYYAEVDFRLEVNYRKDLVFYLIITVGYLIGVIFYKLTGRWESAMLTGELLAVVYVFVTGTVLKKPYFQKSEMHSLVGRSCAALTGAQIFSNLTLNADRLLINAFSTGTDVTVYYTASLLGKAMALLTGPISGVLIGFLAKAKSFGRKQFVICSLLSLFMGGAAFAVFIPLSPIIIGFLYPATVSESSRYFIVANGGQIVYFVSNLLLVMVLRFAPEKVQLYVNVVYSIAFFAVCTVSLIFGDLFVFCTAILILNIIRMITVLFIGIRCSTSEKEATA